MIIKKKMSHGRKTVNVVVGLLAGHCRIKKHNIRLDKRPLLADFVKRRKEHQFVFCDGLITCKVYLALISENPKFSSYEKKQLSNINYENARGRSPRQKASLKKSC